MNPKKFSKKFVRYFYAILALVLALAFLNLGAAYVRADKNEPAFDETYAVEGIPDCSFGYGQCRKGCEANRIENLARHLSGSGLDSRLQECVEDCNFLYGGCKKVS